MEDAIWVAAIILLGGLGVLVGGFATWHLLRARRHKKVSRQRRRTGIDLINN